MWYINRICYTVHMLCFFLGQAVDRGRKRYKGDNRHSNGDDEGTPGQQRPLPFSGLQL